MMPCGLNVTPRVLARQPDQALDLFAGLLPAVTEPGHCSKEQIKQDVTIRSTFYNESWTQIV